MKNKTIILLLMLFVCSCTTVDVVRLGKLNDYYPNTPYSDVAVYNKTKPKDICKKNKQIALVEYSSVLDSTFWADNLTDMAATARGFGSQVGADYVIMNKYKTNSFGKKMLKRATAFVCL